MPDHPENAGAAVEHPARHQQRAAPEHPTRREIKAARELLANALEQDELDAERVHKRQVDEHSARMDRISRLTGAMRVARALLEDE